MYIKRLKLAGITLLIVISQFFSATLANAPHDETRSLTISPYFSIDNTLYGVTRTNLLKSTDRGETWKRLVQGLDNQSVITSVAISLNSPDILYLSTETDGIFKSEDTGASWHRANQGLGTLSISKLYVPFSNGNNVAYAAGKARAVYKTVNGGETWSKVYDNPIPITAINGFGWPNQNHLLMGDNDGGISLSKDGGLHWKPLFRQQGGGAINCIETSQNPLLRDTFYFGSSNYGVFTTTDGGKTFQNNNLGINDLNIRSIAMSKAFKNDAKVFASTWSEAIFVSTDAGSTWKKYNDGITTHFQADQLRVSHFRDIRLSPDFKNDRTLFLAGFDGVFKSVNGGTQWQEVQTLPATLIQTLAVSPAYNKDTTLALTTYNSSIYHSTDDGISWNGIADDVASRNSDIAFSPSYVLDKTMFVSSSPNQIGKSIDKGENWVIHTIPKNGIPMIIALSPAFIEDQTLFVATRAGYIERSTDGGIFFTPIYNEGSHFGGFYISSLVVSPNFTNDRTLLVATPSGVHMSADGGDTWIFKGSKTSFGKYVKFEFSPNYAVDKTIFIAGTGGLFRSTDNFLTWNKVSGDAKGVDGYIEEMAISPNFKNDNTLLMTVRGKGLFKFNNSNSTFKPIGKSLIKNNYAFALWEEFPPTSVSSIRFSPQYASDQTIFGTTMDKIFRSRDGGNNWHIIVDHSKLGVSTTEPTPRP